MKLPFDFAIKFLLRLVLPGAFLAAILWPLLVALRIRLGLAVDDMVVIPIAILVLGWIILLLDMPIYMIAEGRRFWPRWTRRAGLALENWRLAALVKRRDNPKPNSAGRTEFSLEIRKFPIEAATGLTYAACPTRFGNLVMASESYPDRKYGIDGVFGWYRLWVVIDKDLRAEVDDQQAVVDSALYVAFCAGLGALLCLAYAAVGKLAPDCLTVLPTTSTLLWLAGGSLLLSRLMYCAALVAQAQHGELFAALFDQYLDKLEFKPIIDQLAATHNDSSLVGASQRVRARAAIRFLKWHKYRPSSTGPNQDVVGW